ncbi:MAG: sigma-70 family RNA polymerase sigma factor [Anaerolineales bacterium]|nr:sigma-70 family RNA polymerase sigma factor [Anaerolineales bacterium]
MLADRSGNQDDRRLVRDAKAGDVASFDRLVEKYTGRLFRVVRSLASDRYEAEAIVQEAWLRTWKALPRSDAERPFFPWLAQIALNYARDQWRKKRPLDFSDLVETHLQVLDLEVGPEGTLEKQEALQRLKEGIDSLRAEYRLAIALRYDAGMSYEEIAEVLKVPLNTVRTYLHRAKALLRRWMEVENAGLVG